jgi:hypothetical protein
MNPFEIRLLVRAKLCDGRLPLEVSATAVGRPGSGQKCGACDEVMPGNLLMIEISSGIWLHDDCYTLWNEERYRAYSVVSHSFGDFQ